MEEKYSRRIVTFLSMERKKQFRLQLIEEEMQDFEFARKLLKMGIEKYNKDKEEAVKSVRGHMDF